MSGTPPETPSDRLRRLTSTEGQEPLPVLPPPPPPDEGATGPSHRVPRPPAGGPEKPQEAARLEVMPETPVERHPTGAPDRTAGWYRDEMDVTPSAPRPAVPIDDNGMPHVPGRVPETDPWGTRVQPNALRLPSQRRATPPLAPRTPPYLPPHPPPVLPARPTTIPPAQTPRGPRAAGCWWNAVKIVAILSALAAVLVAGGLVVGYLSIASSLPSVDGLRERASQFETTRVYDAKGNLLYEIVDPQAGRRTRVSLDKVSPTLIAATIATEDKDFYQHPGFDPIAIVRAIWQNLRSGDTVSGASTITQQLVRALVLTPEERVQRTNMRKIREIILAAEITRRYSKDEILELYLNEIYYGNLAYGVEAAAETYFGKTAKDLTLAEGAFLAGLPQAPAVYDVYTNPAAAFERHQAVLGLMLAIGCIPISTQVNPTCVTPNDVASALIDMRSRTFVPAANDARYPHWVNYIRQQLEETYGAQTLYRSGFNVYTTLDPDLQTAAEGMVRDQIQSLTERHVTDGALVAMRPSTGEILVMVGSDDYKDPVDGQINMALQPRQPGSSIKPLTYALAFEKGWTPSTLIWDVPTEFPDGANPPYKPVNYDGQFHGPVRVRTALANSYNIPAVKALQFDGIFDAGGFIAFAETLGIRSLTRADYGLSLTLGGGEVTALEMTTAYAALANGGRRVYPISILRVTDSNGKVVCQQPLALSEVKADPPACQAPPANWGSQVISAETAYLISDILSDNAARTPAFGPDSQLRLSFPAAAKTGTTNDFHDNWTIGYTPDLVTSVWVGNADYTPMINTSGVTGAAPIWHNFMEAGLGGGRASGFARPAGIVERDICAISGAEPSEFCPGEAIRREVFAATHPPTPKDRDLWQRAYIDPFTGLRQTAECARYYQNDQLFVQEKVVIAVADPTAQKWLTEDPAGQAWGAAHGIPSPIAWAPTADCTADSPHPVLSIAYPPEGGTVDAKPIQILGQAAASAGFAYFTIDYGLSTDPQGWASVLGPNTNPFPDTGHLADWDLAGLPDGPATLRITVYGQSGRSAEARVHFIVQRPTPTPTATATETLTPTPTETATPEPSATVTSTASLTPVPSETLPPSPTASETPTPKPDE